MSASKSPKAQLTRAIRGTEYEGVSIVPVSAGCFEVWRLGMVYLGMLTKVPSGWGATHNMHPDERTPLFENPVDALRHYSRLGRA